jgi:hypothetical protein
LIKSAKYIVLAILGLLAAALAGISIDYATSVSPLVDSAKSETTITIEPQKHVSFLVVGDSGTGTKPQRKVGLMMERRCRHKRPEGILLLGDVVYPEGVASVDDPQWQDKVFSMYTGDCLKDVPIFPVLGNHDYLGNAASWIEMGDLSQRWTFPSRHYSIVVPGLITIYALDSVYPVRIKKHGIPNFGKSDTPWTIAMGHHPLQSASSAGGGHRGTSISSWIVKNLLCNRVDAYLAGHSHHLEYDPMEECNMDQYISGAGGGEIYPLQENHEAEFASARHGFLEIEVSGKLMKTRFFALQEKIFEKSRTR